MYGDMVSEWRTLDLMYHSQDYGDPSAPTVFRYRIIDFPAAGRLFQNAVYEHGHLTCMNFVFSESRWSLDYTFQSARLREARLQRYVGPCKEDYGAVGTKDMSKQRMPPRGCCLPQWIVLCALHGQVHRRLSSS